jgi:hypothetical protein
MDLMGYRANELARQRLQYFRGPRHAISCCQGYTLSMQDEWRHDLRDPYYPYEFPLNAKKAVSFASSRYIFVSRVNCSCSYYNIETLFTPIHTSDPHNCPRSSNPSSQDTTSRSPELYGSLPGAVGPLGTMIPTPGSNQ